MQFSNTITLAPPAHVQPLLDRLRRRRALRLAYARTMLDTSRPYDEREPDLHTIRQDLAALDREILVSLDAIEEAL